MAHPVFESSPNTSLTLHFKFPFHQKRINEAKNKQIISDILSSRGLSNYEIICVIADKSLTPMTVTIDTPAQRAPSNDSQDLEKIRNVFGDAEMLQ